ncbi:MAG: Rha family transcriptional regulator, partial [Fusobacterium necrophorum]|nr:Rha family transcriptional regulator [Fusobacterium necrophorum]
MNLVTKENMTSLELLEQINLFRKKEGNKKELRHFDLLNIIRNEFEEEITDRKISVSEYKDKTGRKLPMFILTLSQAKQVLVRESKYVRRAIIQYIEKLEQALRKPKQTKRDFQEEDLFLFFIV